MESQRPAGHMEECVSGRLVGTSQREVMVEKRHGPPAGSSVTRRWVPDALTAPWLLAASCRGRYGGLSGDRVAAFLQKKWACVIGSRHLPLLDPCPTPALTFAITPSVGSAAVGDRDEGRGRWCPALHVALPVTPPPHTHTPLALAAGAVC